MPDDDPDATMKLPDPGATAAAPSAGELLARALNTPGPSVGDGRWTPPAPEELAALLPQYQIESLLGHGGMGAVYKGRQAALDRPVAIKLLPAEMAADAQFIARFQREARTLAKLQHPGIVAVHDFGQTSEGHLYFVMEFVDGTDLHRILHAPGGLNPAQALELISQICDALHYAHGKGVIHRDIKPGNILVTTDSRAKLADFGLARPIKDESTMLTGTNVVMGTAAYMAPEQHEGHSDQRADIFALGVMLYEMLCGQRPSGAFDPPSHRVQVDVRLDEVVIKAMQQAPERRYQQVSEMKTDVDRIRTTPGKMGKGKGKKPETGDRKPESKTPRTRVAAIIAACLALAGIAGFFVWEKMNPAREAGAVSGSTSVPPAGPAAPDWSKAVDLLALFDPKDSVLGPWSLENGHLVSVQAPHARAELPYIPPEEYDYRMVFSYRDTKLPSGEVSQFLSKSGRAFRWVMGADSGEFLGFETIAGRNAADSGNPTVKSRPPVLTRATTHTSLVEVRNDGIKAWLDGELVAEWKTDFKDMGGKREWALSNPRVLGVGSFQTALIIEKLEVREVTGKGTLTRPLLTTGTSTPATPTKDGPVRLIDLIALVDVQRDRLRAEGNAGSNQWTKTGGQLAFVSVDKRAGKIAAPVALNGLRDYEVEVGVPTATADPIILDLPMSVTNQATVAFVPGQTVLLRDGNTSKEFGTWPKDAASPPWKLAARVKFDADGMNGTLSATINGTAVGQWRGALGKLGKTSEPHPDFPGQLVPALYVRSGDRTHSSWTLRVFDGEAKVLREVTVTPSPSLPVSESSPVHTFAGHRYQIVSGAWSWEQARQQAAQAGGHLATVTSADEDRFLRAALDRLHPTGDVIRYWIGAYSPKGDGTFTWITGEPFAFTAWGGPEPDLHIKQPGKPGYVFYARDRAFGLPAFAWADVHANSRNLVGYLVEWDDAGNASAPPSAQVGPSSSPSSTATKDAPFVNSLGMKFVPVPITGGPTGGQRVLFSVWETRLQDFRAFWKDTKNTESITANERKGGDQSWAVSWEDATAFCEWLTEHERKAGKLGANERYRLPSDHEWSCAVGIGDREDPAQTPAEKSTKLENVFPWGNAWPPPAGTGNYAGEEVRDLVGKDDWKIDGFIAGYTDAHKFASPPGSFPPNGLGLYDLGGNLSELCEDWMDGAKRYRVARGGSWISREPRRLASSHRNTAAPTTSSRTLGFRCVLAPVAP